MHINATLINLYHVCKRECWLHAHGIRMEHNSDVVAEGKLIGETTYSDRSEKYSELAIDNIKIDYYDVREKVVHEVKKSNKAEDAHIAQVKYYIYVLKKNGIEGVRGKIEYPKMREIQWVELSPEDEALMLHLEKEIPGMLAGSCPPLINKPICKKCSYFDFCWSGEVEVT